MNCAPYFYDASNPWIEELNGVYYRKEDADQVIDDLRKQLAAQPGAPRTGLTPYDLTHFTWRGFWAHVRYFFGKSPRR